MKKINLKSYFLAFAIINIQACVELSTVKNTGPRTIILNGQNYSEVEYGKFVSWKCRDYVYGGKVLVELGQFTNPALVAFGFILLDGTNNGELTTYTRQGITHRWDWGPTGAVYAFTIEPDGTARYYDFTSVEKGTSIKAQEVYKCQQ